MTHSASYDGRGLTRQVRQDRAIGFDRLGIRGDRPLRAAEVDGEGKIARIACDQVAIQRHRLIRSPAQIKRPGQIGADRIVGGL